MGKKDKYAKKKEDEGPPVAPIAPTAAPVAPTAAPGAPAAAPVASAVAPAAVQDLEVNLGALSIKSQQVLSSAVASKIYEGTRGQKYNMEVNFLSVLVDKLIKSAYHYDVTIDPDRPKKFMPLVIKQFQEENFKTTFLAFDGKKNAYSAAPLKFKGDEFTATVNLPVEAGRVKEYKVTIKLAATIDMKILSDYKSPQFTSFEKPSQALQCLEIVLRSAFDRNKGVVAGRAIYRKPTEKMDLSEGMELYMGFFQAAQLGRKQLYLNVDVSHKAFPTGMPLLQFLSLNGPVPNALNDFQSKFLNDHLKGLELEYKIGEIARIMKYQGLKKPANVQTFKNDKGQMITIADFFKKEKNYTLKYPGLPTIHVGSSVKAQYVPLELCSIKDMQATNKKCSPNVVAKMIRFSATSTMKRKEKIMDLLKQIDYNNPTYKQFGIDVNKANFEKVEARILQPPTIIYANGNVMPGNGSWKNDGKKFKEVPREQAGVKWSIINFDKYINFNAVQSFKTTVMKAAHAQNILLNEVDPNSIVNLTVRDNLVGVFDDYIKKGYKFVVVIITEEPSCYPKVKQASELRSAGILTQCIKSRTVGRMDTSIMGNILLKVNAKLNGMNHELDEMSYNGKAKNQGIMFVGGDVTHPSPDQQSIPSVVGVTASYDQLGAKYSCSWRLQGPRVEMIMDFKNIMISHLQFYNAKNPKCWPKKIMYYRDGVSDGQFQEALTVELTAIREACFAINPKYKPAVTFIIVQKRHHTRFFPDKNNSDGPKNQNVRAGTVVDKDIVHPHQFQFYLASHAAIQGVSKPSKYTVIHDDAKFNVDDLQAITYDLCHLFTRCNRSVSYVAPTYYSHLVAARGKNYILGDDVNLEQLNAEYEKRTIKPTVGTANPMFFV